MNQSTHAWLAVEAYRKVLAASTTPDGKAKKLEGLSNLLGQYLQDVVVASWLPDSLIKDMATGHVFKNSKYEGDQAKRFTLTKEDLGKHLSNDTVGLPIACERVPDAWWARPYRVKDGGGHLPARVTAVCAAARDMLKMGDKDVSALTGIKPAGAAIIADDVLYSPRNVAMMLWMASHYIADAHMPFHSDNRALALSDAKHGFKAHGQVEDEWGRQVPEIFKVSKILGQTSAEILDAKPPAGSHFDALDLGPDIPGLKNSGDPWKEAVFICRAAFALSFALVPESVAAVDDRTTTMDLDTIRSGSFCDEATFWRISRAIMTDAANAIARFWQDVWVDFTAEKSHS